MNPDAAKTPFIELDWGALASAIGLALIIAAVVWSILALVLHTEARRRGRRHRDGMGIRP